MAARWDWELTNSRGVTLAPLNLATGRTLTFKRNSYGEASCTISHSDPAAQAIMDGLANGDWPALRCWRWADGATSGTLRFRGFLAPFSEDLEEAATLSLVFRGPFWRLVGEGDRAGRYTANWIGCTTADAGDAAASLVKIYGGLASGVTGGSDTTFVDGTGAAVTYNEASYAGLDIGTIEATATRDLTYQYANVGESIGKLAEMLDGFDFEESYVDSGTTLANFNVYASMGGDRTSAVFNYGEDTIANVRSVSRQWQPPINYVRLLGAYGYSSIQQDATSVASYGKWIYNATRSDIFTQTELDRAAYALLRPAPVRTLSFQPDPALSPLPWDDYWLGDTVHFYGRRDAFEQSAELRVNAITVAINEDGYESAEIPDPQAPDETAWLRANLSGEVT